MLNPVADGPVIGLGIGYQLQDAFIEFRQQNRRQQIQQHADDHPGQQDAQRPDCHSSLSRLHSFFHSLDGTKLPLEKVHHRHQQISHKRAVKYGADRPGKLSDKLLEDLVAKERIIKK